MYNNDKIKWFLKSSKRHNLPSVLTYLLHSEKNTEEASSSQPLTAVRRRQIPTKLPAAAFHFT